VRARRGDQFTYPIDDAFARYWPTFQYPSHNFNEIPGNPSRSPNFNPL